MIGEVKLQEKIVYGKPRYYPGNPLAYKLLVLLNQKSFTQADLPKLRDLGVSLQIAPPEPAEVPWTFQVAADKKNAAEGKSAPPLASPKTPLEGRLENQSNQNPTVQNVSSELSTEKTHPPLTITRQNTEDESFEAFSHQLPIWQAPK